MISGTIGAVFIPVREIRSARTWYARLLGVSPEGDILFGHLWVVPMAGETKLVLDSKDFKAPHDAKPIFYFRANDLQAAHDHCRRIEAPALEPIRDAAFFTLKDIDGNLFMVANVDRAGPNREECLWARNIPTRPA